MSVLQETSIQRPRMHAPAADATHRWTVTQLLALYGLPFSDLIHQAQETHRQFHDPNAIQLSSLLSIKTGGCPEDCAYCPQSSVHNTGMEKEALLPVTEVL